MSHEQSHDTPLPTTTVASDLAEISSLREQIFGKIFDAVTLEPITNIVPYLQPTPEPSSPTGPTWRSLSPPLSGPKAATTELV